MGETRQTHLLCLKRGGEPVSLPSGCTYIPVPGSGQGVGEDISHERPADLFDAAAARYLAMLDEVAEANSHRRSWLHCQSFLVKRHRSPAFRYIFILEAVDRYRAGGVTLHCDDYHLYLCACGILGLKAVFYGTPGKVSRRITTAGGLLWVALKRFGREIVSLFKRFLVERKVRKPESDSGSDTLVLTHDTYYPWNRESDKSDRIWGPLDKALRADFGVVHRMDGRNARFVAPHGASSILLMDSWGKLLRSLCFRLYSLWVFVQLVVFRQSPTSIAGHLKYFGVLLFEDAVINGPHWHEYMVGVHDFLLARPGYRHVVVQGEFHNSGRVVFLTARELGRRAYAYALSVHYDAHLQIRLTPKEVEIFDMPDAFLVWSRRTVRLLRAYAPVLPRTCIVGQCRLAEECGNRRTRPEVVGIMESTADSPGLFDIVLRNHALFNGVSFYLKGHPTKHTVYDSMDMEALPIKVELCRDMAPTAFFERVDVVMVGATTAGAEALKLGIPVVVAGEAVSWGMTTLHRHAPGRGVYVAETAEELADGIRYFREADIDRKAMDREYGYYVDTFHPERIRNLFAYFDRKQPRAEAGKPNHSPG